MAQIFNNLKCSCYNYTSFVEMLSGGVTLHCYKYKLTKSGSGGFLASHLLEQDLNRVIEHLQEQELKKNQSKKIMQEQVLKKFNTCSCIIITMS